MTTTEHRMRDIIGGRGFPRSLYHWQQLAGIPASTFYAVVKERRIPSVHVALKLAVAGKCTVEEIFAPEPDD